MNVYERLIKHGPLDDAKLLDLREQGSRYYFRISGSERGFGDGVQAVKHAFVPFKERSYNPTTHEWSVPATPEAEQALCAIFGNAANAFLALHGQMRMFD